MGIYQVGDEVRYIDGQTYEEVVGVVQELGEEPRTYWVDIPGTDGRVLLEEEEILGKAWASKKKGWLFDYAPGFRAKTNDGRTYVVTEDQGNSSKIKFEDGLEITKTKSQLDDMTVKVLDFASSTVSWKRGISSEPSVSVTPSFDLGDEVKVKGKGTAYILDENPLTNEVTVILDDEEYSEDNVMIVRMEDLEHVPTKKGGKLPRVAIDFLPEGLTGIPKKGSDKIMEGDRVEISMPGDVYDGTEGTVIGSHPFKNEYEVSLPDGTSRVFGIEDLKVTGSKKTAADPTWTKDFDQSGLAPGARVKISDEDPIPPALKNQFGVLTEKSPYYDSYMVQLDDPILGLEEYPIAGRYLSLASYLKLADELVDRKGMKKVVSKKIVRGNSEIYEITSSDGEVDYVTGDMSSKETYTPLPEKERTQIKLELAKGDTIASEEKGLDVMTMGDYSFDYHEPVWLVKETGSGFVLERLPEA